MSRFGSNARLSWWARRLASFATVCGCLLAPPAGRAASADPPRLLIEDRVLNPVDERLFGQFMEIASWGEPGPEALVDPATGTLPEGVVDLLRWMGPPVIRFPGGTDVDDMDWTHRIDGVPGRGIDRPLSHGQRDNTITSRFGYDEFLRLAESIGAEPMLVVNFGSAVSGPWSVEAGAEKAASMVAYCNAEPGEHTGSDGVDWGGVRAANGREAPWGVKYWQIGNEVWFYFRKAAEERAAAGVDRARWMTEALVAYARAMKAVDPSITLIFDGKLGDAELERQVLGDAEVRSLIDMVTLHRYQPGGVKRVLRRGNEIDPAELSSEELWYAWVSMPSDYGDEGQTLAFRHGLAGPRTPYTLASTEWNWNGWGGGINRHEDLSSLAQGLGVAGFLHGMMRQGEHLRLATQSMLVGVSWGIAAIQADPDGAHPPYIQPSGLATGLYRRHHGDRLLASRLQGKVPSATQDLAIEGWGRVEVRSPLPLLDVAVTRSDDAVFIHAINRRLHASQPLSIDLSAFDHADTADRWTLAPKPAAERVEARDAASVTATHHQFDDGATFHVTLPPASVSILRVAIRHGP